VLLMDEPFGAIDPITRGRLQDEFLRLQDELHKTIVFVTHDIEEAVRLGDRIAILRQGGVLEQYDTPANVLGRPASPFVASFVGADRSLKRLAVTPLATAALDQPPIVGPDDDVAAAGRALDAMGAAWGVVLDGGRALRGSVARADLDGTGPVGARVRAEVARVPVGASLHDALAELLQHDAPWVAVVDEGRYVGVLRPESLHAALRQSVAASAEDGGHG
jgi:osmoprotectant transport system ATP-binding protein